MSGRVVARAGMVNATFKVLSATGNFLLMPFFLHAYGMRTYGVVSLLLSMAQYLSVLDLGLTGALIQEASRTPGPPRRGYFRLRRRVGLYLAIGGGTLTAVAAVTVHIWGPILRLDPVPDLGLAVAGAGVMAAMALVSSCYNSLIIAELRFFHSNVVNLSRTFLPQISAAVVFLATNRLGVSLAAGGACAVLVLGVQVAALRWAESEPSDAGAPDPNEGDRIRFWRATASFSAQTLSAVLLLPTLQVLVGAKAGPIGVAHVDIARRLLYAGRNAVEALFTPVFSVASRLSFARRPDDALRLAMGSTGAASLLALVFYVIGRLGVPPVLVVWLGEAGRDVTPVCLLMLVGVAFTIPHIGMYHVLAATPRGRVVNMTASALGLAVLLLAVLPGFTGTSAVLRLFAASTLCSTGLIVGAGIRYLRRVTARAVHNEEATASMRVD